jgi:hypothetical protein
MYAQRDHLKSADSEMTAEAAPTRDWQQVELPLGEIVETAN